METRWECASTTGASCWDERSVKLLYIVSYSNGAQGPQDSLRRRQERAISAARRVGVRVLVLRISWHSPVEFVRNLEY